MNELVSVVVPVYNTAPYIERCAESLLRQTYPSVEVLLIDDGSSDGSDAVCDALAEKYAAVRVLHKTNGGAAAARFNGTQAATGSYVTYVDSDDFVDENYILNLYHAIKKYDADCACCGYRETYRGGREFGKEKYVIPEDERCLNCAQTFELMFYDKLCPATVNCKLFRTEQIRQIVPMDIQLGEDSYVCEEYFLGSKKIVHLGYAGYYYDQREASAVHTADGIAKYDYVRLYDVMAGDVQEKCPTANGALANKLAEENFVVLLALWERRTQYKEEIAHIRANIKRYRRAVLTDRRAEMRTRAACLLSCFGMGTVAAVYYAAKKHGEKR
ncbi:MAG: glycosyltransferase family 2 protein [Clostridia bacterium]|nr:glycosyltransferase family 2 protein [Clostridia bacterium]